MTYGHVFFYKWLTEIEQEQFVDNFEKEKGYPLDEYLNKEFERFSQFIDKAFGWEGSNEGYTYWNKIYGLRKQPLIK